MELEILVSLPPVHSLRTRLHELVEEVLAEQLRIVAIPAPTGAEAERGRHVAGRFAELGLADVATDEVGNVLARLPGSPPERSGAVLVTAHLDTVFAAGTELTPRREGQRIRAPGITDNARGLAALLGLARVLAESGLRTERPLWFVATVGEEGAGDLRGVKHLFRRGSPFAEAAAFLSLDGSGSRRVVHRAIGSLRLRARLTGPGGHSWADFGTVNAIHALGAAIAELRQIHLSVEPATTLTVARCAGGTSINSIPSEAWLELDLRSESAELLDDTERRARAAFRRAVDAENLARLEGTAELRLEIEVIGHRPSGTIPAHSPLVRTAAAVTRLLGAEPELVASSTDANVPIALGIPAITIGAGGRSGGIHTLDEWFEPRDGARGLERALLIALSAAVPRAP